MTQWATFLGITGVVLVLLLVLSHLTQSSFESGDHGQHEARDGDGSHDCQGDHDGHTTTDTRDEHNKPTDLHSRVDDTEQPSDGPHAAATQTPDNASSKTEHASDDIDPSSLSSGVLLANVALSQGVFAFVLIGAAIYTAIPASALGLEFSRDYLETGLLIGALAGIVLYVANEIGAAVATRAGFTHDERLRELLAPESARGWGVLLVGVLPIIAVFEELLFRAAIIGVISTHYGVDPWILAVVSSLAFALGHGIQGSVGIIITGTLGFALAAIFIITGSFLVVVVAHYLINALEFIVHEGLDRDWASGLEASTNDRERDSQG